MFKLLFHYYDYSCCCCGCCFFLLLERSKQTRYATIKRNIQNAMNELDGNNTPLTRTQLKTRRTYYNIFIYFIFHNSDKIEEEKAADKG